MTKIEETNITSQSMHHYNHTEAVSQSSHQDYESGKYAQ